MPVLKVDVEPSDLNKSGWSSAVKGSGGCTVGAYASAFRALSDEHETNERSKQATVFSLLSAVCYITLAPGRSEGPFVPKISSSSRRTLLPEDLSESELDILEHVFSETDDPELKARMGDILWLRRRDHQVARTTVKAYMASVSKLEGQEEHVYVPERIERAVALAAMLDGPSSETVEQVLEETASIVRARTEQGATTRTLDLLDLLLDRIHGDLVKWAEVAKRFAISLEDQSDFHPAQMFWSRAVRAYAKISDTEARRDAQIREAEAYVMLADEAPSEMAKASFIRNAFEAYRHIRNTDDRQEELHQRLLQHQEKGVGEMGQISTEVNLGDLPQQARNAVKGQDLIQALYSLALLKPPIDPDRLRRDTEEGIEETPFQFMLPTERVNALGRVLAARPSGMDEPEKALRAMLHDDANRSHQFDASALINPARVQILNDHPTVQIRDLMPLMHHNAFVPRNRQLQFARGLHAGLEGDFLISTHLLIP